MSHIRAIYKCHKECRGDPNHTKKWDNLCCNYHGEYPLSTRRDMMKLNVDNSYTCSMCLRSPCLWTSVGDSLIDVVGLEM